MTRPTGRRRAPSNGQLPTRSQLLDFIQTSAEPVGKRELARAFGLGGADKVALKALLKALEEEGALQRGAGRRFAGAGANLSTLPSLLALKVVETRADGDVFAEPDIWDQAGRPPRFLVSSQGGGPARRGARRTSAGPALGLGDRFMARLETRGARVTAHLVKRLDRRIEAVLGVVQREGALYRLEPVDKRTRAMFSILADNLDGAKTGELVLAEPLPRHRPLGLQEVKVIERLGDPFQPRSLSLIAIMAKRLPLAFSQGALEEAERAAALAPGPRADLTALPFLAIDPVDARDHDDAIWATAREDGGWTLAVAIADVSYYVRSGSALDAEARARGNSAYFPDRVVPMLPEALSAGICSLKAGERRAALVCHMEIGADGALRSFRFERAAIRLVANLAYEAAQATIDARAGAHHDLLASLWGAWAALSRAREARAPLDLDLPERRILLDADGRVIAVQPRARLDAHRVVEDFMIAANVAAARALERAGAPCVYRVHEEPSRDKLAALKTYLSTLGVSFALGQVMKPALFNALLARIQGEEWAEQAQEQVLRTQTQAYYGLDNLGHFGLQLASYAHFTSPIRRYADLVVHRSLVRALGLGEDGLDDASLSGLPQVAEHISMTERRAMEAERETIDRYVAAHLAPRVGETLPGRVTGATRFGLFVALDGLGGDGLVPISTLGDERFTHDPAAQTLTGSHTGVTYRLGRKLALKLLEANPVTGNLRFAVVHDDVDQADRPDTRIRPRVIKRRGRI